MIVSCWGCFFREVLLMTIMVMRFFRLLLMWGWAL